jgi:hypothetical protein
VAFIASQVTMTSQTEYPSVTAIRPSSKIDKRCGFTQTDFSFLLRFSQPFSF